MKSTSGENLNCWLGLPVFKLEVDDHGTEMHIQGKVITYCSSSKCFVLLYTDGSSDDVPVDEIEDHLPLRLQFKANKRSNKRRAEVSRGDTAQSPTKRKRLSETGKTKPTPQSEPKQADKWEVMSHFVQDTLWALTTVLDVSEEKQKALLTTLNSRNEQPFAALEQYMKEGGLDALYQTLRGCASANKVAHGEAEANTHQHTAERETSPETRDSRSKRSSRVSANRGRCDKHLHELLQGNTGGSFSPQPTQLKKQRAPHKPKPRRKELLHKNPSNTPAEFKTTVMAPDDFVPVTQESEEDEVDGTRSAHRRLRFDETSWTQTNAEAAAEVGVEDAGNEPELTRSIEAPTTAMNYGIINNRRPDPSKRGAASSVNALLADPRMREIAKQMGLQPKDFGEEAQALWNTLNDLSTSDPKRYESFINEQLQDGPPSEASSNRSSTDTPPPRFFTPEPGFVVKCCMYHSIKCQQKETKLFLNICAHTLIDAPKNPNSGLEVPEDTRAVPNTNSLQVPLVVGKLREISDFGGAVCCVVDVVVNPWVLRRCEWDANFKRETMKLAVQWVQEDARVRLVTPTGKFIKARYKGGVSVGSDIITSKFRIEDADPTKQRMESPADLLKQINMDEAKQNEDTQELKITSSKDINIHRKPDVVLKATSPEQAQPPPAPVEAKPQKILIEELPSPTNNEKTVVQTTAVRSKQNAKTAAQGKTKSGGAVKRGFLNSSKVQLYPKGSNEGRPSSSYVNLLSRSKVVDLGEMEQQQKGPNQKRVVTATSSDEIDHGDHIFDQLCEQAEPDLKTIHKKDATSSDQLFGDGFEELAKLLTP